MKNSEIASAVVGGAFFAVPYLALSIPIVQSLVIGACAFAAGELVFRTDVVESLKETNISLYQTLENAKKHWEYILGAGEKYVKPARAEADIILNGDTNLTYFCQILEYIHTITNNFEV